MRNRSTLATLAILAILVFIGTLMSWAACSRDVVQCDNGQTMCFGVCTPIPCEDPDAGIVDAATYESDIRIGLTSLSAPGPGR